MLMIYHNDFNWRFLKCYYPGLTFCCHYKTNPSLSSVILFGETVNEGENGSRVCYPNLPVCLPCSPGCKQCKDGSPCWVQEDWLLRAGVLAVQGLFMALVLISMLRTYQCRRTRVSPPGWGLLTQSLVFLCEAYTIAIFCLANLHQNLSNGRAVELLVVSSSS